MKRIISLLIIITIILTILPQAMADLNDGLVAYWPFNGNASDESGNGNDGVVNGATPCDDRYGNMSSAYCFDGVNDYIDIPYSASIEPSIFSISIWFRTSSENQGALITSDPNSFRCNHGYTIVISGKNRSSWIVVPDGTPQYHIDPTGRCGDGTIISGGSPLNNGNWHHLIAIYNGASMKMYVDGVLQDETKDTSYSKTHASIRIGMVRRTVNHPEWRWFYQGSIDDIRFYNRVLTDSEIQELYLGDFKELLYTAVKPCRIVDTRKTSSGIIGANSDRDFRVYGLVGGQGGNSAGCPSPGGEPYATHINMVAVNPTGKGNLQAFPVGAGAGAGLSVNYNTIDTNLANAGTVKTVTGSGADITVASNFSSAHTVIDVLGYYYPDEGFYYTPVDPCRIVDTRKTSAGIIDANTERDFRVSGPVGDQGGNPAGCPSTLGVSPEAAHLNMVAVNPTGKGNLQAFPVGAGTGAGLSVNYNTIDTNLANAGTVKTSPDITVASNFSSAHTAIDVLGYYSEEEDLLYTPVIPCRIVDTRKTSVGMIDASTQRNFNVYGSGATISAQGGDLDGCPSPLDEPHAVHINMVAVNPTGKGNLQAFPVGAGTGAGLSVNYNTIDTNLANAGTVKTVTGSGPDISVASNFSSAHTVIDVLGYYYPAP